MNQNVLVGTDVVDEKSIRALSRYSRVYKLADLTEDRLNQVLPSIHCLVVFSWPNQLTSDRLQKMASLLFIQSILAVVNHIPFAGKKSSVKGVKFVTGTRGLFEHLMKSLVAVFALRLTGQTARIFNAERLSEMRKDGILVNVARGELVDEKAMYDYLVANPNF